MRKVTMIKKIKITNNKARTVFRDTTNGCVYLVIEVPKGAQCPDGTIAVTDGLSFKDDVGDWVDIFKDGRGYEVVEEDKPMTNNNWNTVNWDKTPEDVDAVVTFKRDEPSYYKVVGGQLEVQGYRGETFHESLYGSIGAVIKRFGDRVHLRPTPITQPTVEPTPEPPESTQAESSEVDMYAMFKGADSKPSISTILQEAQQSILKHHGVTGEVKFTVTCS